MYDQKSMFGDVPSEKIQENVRVIMKNISEPTLEKVYEEFLVLYHVTDIQNHPEWDMVWKLICEAPTIQRRVRDYQNGQL